MIKGVKRRKRMHLLAGRKTVWGLNTSGSELN